MNNVAATNLWMILLLVGHKMKLFASNIQFRASFCIDPFSCAFFFIALPFDNISSIMSFLLSEKLTSHLIVGCIDIDGARLGSCEGNTLGDVERVGNDVGKEDGKWLGLDDAIVDGLLVGSNDGTADGIVLGTPDGEKDGFDDH